MKREIGAAVLLTALVLTALWNVRRADFLTDQIACNLDRSERAADRGDMETALTALDNAIALWDDEKVYTGVFLRHPDVDSVSDAFFELRELLLRKDAEAAPAALSRLRYHLDTIDFMEHLSVGTIF